MVMLDGFLLYVFVISWTNITGDGVYSAQLHRSMICVDFRPQ